MLVVETLQQLDGIPFRAMDDDNFHPPHDNVVIYDSWRLGGDGTVNKHGAEGPYNWTNCELTSPVMGSHDYGTKIEDVCRVLQAVRIHLNKSTAVHIHVGRGNEPFRLVFQSHLSSPLVCLKRNSCLTRAFLLPASARTHSDLSTMTSNG